MAIPIELSEVAASSAAGEGLRVTDTSGFKEGAIVEKVDGSSKIVGICPCMDGLTLCVEESHVGGILVIVNEEKVGEAEAEKLVLWGEVGCERGRGSQIRPVV